MIHTFLHKIIDPDEDRVKQPKHAPVLSERLPGKGLDASMPGSLGELREEQLPHPPRLPPVFDEEGELGLASAFRQDVDGVTDDLVTHDGDERRRLVIRARDRWASAHPDARGYGMWNLR